MKRKQVTTSMLKTVKELSLTREEKESNLFYVIDNSDYLLQINDNLQTFDCVEGVERLTISKEMWDSLVNTLLSINIKFVMVMEVSLYDTDMNYDPVFDTKESTDSSFQNWYLNHKQSIWEDLARLKIVTPAGLITVFPNGVITFPDITLDTKYDIIFNLVTTWNNLLFPIEINKKTTKFLKTTLK